MNPTIRDRPSPLRPAGQDKGAWLAVLEQGANLLQDASPLKDFDVYVVGFHCPKGDPQSQMEAHHCCRVVNDDLLLARRRREGVPQALDELLRQDLAHVAYGASRWRAGRRAAPGDPKLMWSFNRDGECDEALKADRDEAMGIDTARKREERQSFVDLAHPQRGVDAMRDQFTGTTPIPGVVDVRAADSSGG